MVMVENGENRKFVTLPNLPSCTLIKMRACSSTCSQQWLVLPKQPDDHALMGVRGTRRVSDAGTWTSGRRVTPISNDEGQRDDAFLGVAEELY